MTTVTCFVSLLLERYGNWKWKKKSPGSKNVSSEISADICKMNQINFDANIRNDMNGEKETYTFFRLKWRQKKITLSFSLEFYVMPSWISTRVYFMRRSLSHFGEHVAKALRITTYKKWIRIRFQRFRTEHKHIFNSKSHWYDPVDILYLLFVS